MIFSPFGNRNRIQKYTLSFLEWAGILRKLAGVSLGGVERDMSVLRTKQPARCQEQKVRMKAQDLPLLNKPREVKQLA